MNKIVLVILSFLLVTAISTDAIGQHLDDLTDREILIQLIEKFEHLEKAVLRIEFSSDITRNKITSIDREIYKNSIEINSLFERYKAAVVRWNTLLGLFATFILGIFVWMWRRAYNGKEKLVRTNK